MSMSIQQAVLDGTERCRAPPCLLVDSLMDVLDLLMAVGGLTAPTQHEGFSLPAGPTM